MKKIKNASIGNYVKIIKNNIKKTSGENNTIIGQGSDIDYNLNQQKE